MAYSNQTTHYGLPLPVGSDKSSWLDNNTAFAAIDTAIYQASTDAGAAAGDIAILQNDVTSLQSGKQDVLTWDATPTNGSLNPVRSGGVYSAIDSINTEIGTSDISAIGDGTIKGAILSLNPEVVSVTISAGTIGSELTQISNNFNTAKVTPRSKIVLTNGRVFSVNASKNYGNTYDGFSDVWGGGAGVVCGEIDMTNLTYYIAIGATASADHSTDPATAGTAYIIY